MVEIKQAQGLELTALIPIYTQAFKEHKIFNELSGEKIHEYIQKEHERNVRYGGGFFVAIDDEKVIGGIHIARVLDAQHTRWKFRHLAVLKTFRGKGVGTKILKAAENQLKELIKQKRFRSAKIEITVAEGEKDTVAFYKKAGYKLEGTLLDHYRLGEKVYTLGKTIK